MVYDFLVKYSEEVSLDDFIRLYILFGIYEFFSPNRSGGVFPILFSIVDDLGSLWKYNWGGLVYDYLVGSIWNALMFLRDKGNTTHFHVIGFVYLLQVIIV